MPPSAPAPARSPRSRTCCGAPAATGGSSPAPPATSARASSDSPRSIRPRATSGLPPRPRGSGLAPADVERLLWADLAMERPVALPRGRPAEHALAAVANLERLQRAVRRAHEVELRVSAIATALVRSAARCRPARLGRPRRRRRHRPRDRRARWRCSTTPRSTAARSRRSCRCSPSTRASSSTSDPRRRRRSRARAHRPHRAAGAAAAGRAAAPPPARDRRPPRPRSSPRSAAPSSASRRRSRAATGCCSRSSPSITPARAGASSSSASRPTSTSPASSRCYAAAGVANVVLCVDAARSQRAALAAPGSALLPFRRTIDAAALLARMAPPVSALPPRATCRRRCRSRAASGRPPSRAP